MNRILHLLQDEHGIRPIADVFADENAVGQLYDALYAGADMAWFALDGDLRHLSMLHGFVPTDWEAALLIETELEQHYGVGSHVYFTDWSDRIGEMNTLQPTDEDRIAMYNRDIDAYVATFDGCPNGCGRFVCTNNREPLNATPGI